MMTEHQPIDWEALDPGRGWRRLARLGALLCVAALLLPSGRPFGLGFPFGPPLVSYMPGIVRHILGRFLSRAVDPQVLNPEMVIVHSAIVMLFFIGPVNLLVCSPRVLSPGRRRRIQLCGVLALWLVAALLPFYAAHGLLRALDPQDPRTQISLALLLTYLLASGLTCANSRRWRGTPLLIFCLEIVPLFLASLAALLALVINALSGPWFDPPLILCSLSLLGNAMMLVGWMMWWRAVNTEWERQAPNSKLQ